MLRCLTWLAALACSSNDDTVKETHDFSDGEGRRCHAVLERMSSSSAVVFSSVECNGAIKDCSSESTACFQLSVEPTSSQLRNCPACCKGSSSSFVSSECSPVVCEDDADCVFPDAKCDGGACSCADGHCE